MSFSCRILNGSSGLCAHLAIEPITPRTALSPLRASTTTTLPFLVQTHVLVLAGPRHHPLLFADPSSPPPPKGPSGLSAGILSQPHASSLSPPLWSVTNLLRGRGGLHGLTILVDTEVSAIRARVCGLPRFDRITAAVSPMRDFLHGQPECRYRTRRCSAGPRTHRLHGDSPMQTLSSRGTTDASRSSCLVRPVFPDNYGVRGARPMLFTCQRTSSKVLPT